MCSDINCRECGSHFSPCIASGQSILAKEYYSCKTCKHKALESELNYLKLKHCPLCHGKISLNEPSAGNAPAAMGSAQAKSGITRQK